MHIFIQLVFHSHDAHMNATKSHLSQVWNMRSGGGGREEKFKSGLPSHPHTAGQSQHEMGVGVIEVTDMVERRGPR